VLNQVIPATVQDLLLGRRAVRAFTDDPVPDEVLRQLLSDALQAPSGGNLQPWHIHVVRGAARQQLVTAIREKAAAGMHEEPAYAIYPPSLWEPYRSRRFENGEDLYRSIGIERHDKSLRFEQLAKNFEFFGAPVGLFFTIDQRMTLAQWIDLGIVIQTVMLLAQEQGLATCPQVAWAAWPATLAAVLGLHEHETVVAGMALGYADTSHPINTLRSTRQSFDEAVTVHDGADPCRVPNGCR
jgi:nitroreductase